MSTESDYKEYRYIYTEFKNIEHYIFTQFEPSSRFSNKWKRYSRNFYRTLLFKICDTDVLKSLKFSFSGKDILKLDISLKLVRNIQRTMYIIKDMKIKI
jgi:hypothetical protein